MILFHATASHNLQTIMKEGLRPNSYWSQDTGIRDYYMETIEDDGEEPVVLTITLEKLMELTQGHHTGLEPDYPGLEEPITSVLGKSERTIQEEWRSCTQNWRNCLDLIGSVRCSVSIPAEYVKLLAQDQESNHALSVLIKTPNSRP